MRKREGHDEPLPDRDILPPTISQHGKGTEDGWREARERERLVLEYLGMVESGWSLGQAARVLGRSPAFFCGADSWVTRYQRDGVAGLLPQRRQAGAKPSFEVPDWFVPASRYFYLLTNRTRTSGSVPESVRRTISLPALPVGWKDGDRARFLRALGQAEVPECPEELRERILAREREGKPLVPERLARAITVSPSVVRQYRNPTDAGLDYLCAPGGMRMVQEQGGQVRLARPGEVIECDDATINFPVCIPWSLGGDACSEKYGVRVGRFQWLVAIDVGTSYVPAFVYTARPRSSYRGEDVLQLFRAVTRQHGVPEVWRLEQGIWRSNLVKDAVRLMGSRKETVYSPHQKPFIEGLFNTLWTKLAVQFPGSQVGRFQGEQESGNDLLTACQRGQRDPRKHFPMLSQAIAAMEEVIGEKNRTPVQSDGHGRWVPEERWASGSLRRLSPESDWLFSPLVREWSVRGMLVGGRVPLFEDLSVPFDFAADWLVHWDGARVRCYFDPMEPQCTAMICLAEDLRGHKAGEVLGGARQVNEIGGYVRFVLGWAKTDEAGAGRLERQQAAAAMRREVRGVIPRQAGSRLAVSEERDGVAGRVTVESGSAAAAPQAAVVRRDLAAMPEPLARPALEDPSLSEFLEVGDQ